MQNQIFYCDYNSVLVVNPKGQLKQLYVPFNVTAKAFTGKGGERYTVEEVRSTDKDELVYVIGGKNYYYHQFTIDIKF